jgi:hypothetical protein
MMSRPLRALASLITAFMTVIRMTIYQHYSREPPSDTFAVAVTMAPSVLAWVMTGLD